LVNSLEENPVWLILSFPAGGTSLNEPLLNKLIDLDSIWESDFFGTS